MIKINLLPAGGSGSRWRPRLPAPGLGLVFAVAYALLALTAGASWWYLSASESRVAAATLRANAELVGLRAAVLEAGQARLHITDLQKRAALLETLTNTQGRGTLLVAALADAVPPTVWLSGVEDKASVLTVKGSARSSTALSELLGALRRDARFVDVEVVQVKQDVAKDMVVLTFEISCRFRG